MRSTLTVRLVGAYAHTYPHEQAMSVCKEATKESTISPLTCNSCEGFCGLTGIRQASFPIDPALRSSSSQTRRLSVTSATLRSPTTTTADASFEHMLGNLPNQSLVELHDLLLSQGRRNIKRPEIVFAVVDELIRRPLDPVLGQQVNAILGWQFSGAAVVLEEENAGSSASDGVAMGIDGPSGASSNTLYLPVSAYETHRQRYASAAVRRRFDQELSFYQRKSTSASNNASNSIFAFGRLIRDACDLCYTLHDYERAIELFRNKALGGGRAYVRRQKQMQARRLGGGDAINSVGSGFKRRTNKRSASGIPQGVDDESNDQSRTEKSTTLGSYEAIDTSPSVCELAPFIQLTPTLVDAAFLLGDSVDAALEALEEIADAATCRLLLYPTDGVAELVVHRCFWRVGVLWRDVKAEVAPSTNIVRGGRKKLLMEAKEELRVLITALKKEKRERHAAALVAKTNADENPDEVYNNASRMAAFLEEMTANQLATATSSYHQLSNMFRSAASKSDTGNGHPGSSLHQLFHAWPQAIRDEMHKMQRIEWTSLRMFYQCLCSPAMLGNDSCPLLRLHATYLNLRRAHDKQSRLRIRKDILTANHQTLSRSPNASEASISATSKKLEEVEKLLEVATENVTKGAQALFQPHSTAIITDNDAAKSARGNATASTTAVGANDGDLSLTLELLRRITRHRENPSNSEDDFTTVAALEPGYNSWVALWNPCIQAIAYNEATDDGCCDYHLAVFRDFMKNKKERELTAVRAPPSHVDGSAFHQSVGEESELTSLKRGILGNTAIVGEGNITDVLVPERHLSALAGTPHDALVLALLHTCSVDSQMAAATSYFQWYLETCKRRLSTRPNRPTLDEAINGTEDVAALDGEGLGSPLVVRGQRSASGVVIFGYFQQLTDMKEHTKVVEAWKVLYSTMLDEEAEIMRTLHTLYPTTPGSVVNKQHRTQYLEDGTVVGQSLSPTVGRSMLCRPSIVALVARAAGELKQGDLVRELMQLMLSQGRGSDEGGAGGETLSEVAKAVMAAYTDGFVDPEGGAGEMLFGSVSSSIIEKATTAPHDDEGATLPLASPTTRRHRKETVALANYLDVLTQKVPQPSPYETFIALTAMAKCGSPQLFGVLHALACAGKGTPEAADAVSSGTKLVSLSLEEELFLYFTFLSAQPNTIYALTDPRLPDPLAEIVENTAISFNGSTTLLLEHMARAEARQRRLDIIFEPILMAMRDGIYYFFEFPLFQVGGNFHDEPIAGNGGPDEGSHRPQHGIRLRSSAYRKSTVVTPLRSSPKLRGRPSTSPPFHVKDLLTQRVLTPVLTLCSTVALSPNTTYPTQHAPTVRGVTPTGSSQRCEGDVPITQLYVALFDAFEKATAGNTIPVSWLDSLVRYRNTHHRTVVSLNPTLANTVNLSAADVMANRDVKEAEEAMLEFVYETIHKFGMSDPSRWSVGRTEAGGAPRGSKRLVDYILETQLKLGLVSVEHHTGAAPTYDSTLYAAAAAGRGTVSRDGVIMVVGGPLTDLSKNHLRLLLQDYSQHLQNNSANKVTGLLGSSSLPSALASSALSSLTITNDVALRFLDRRHNAVSSVRSRKAPPHTSLLLPSHRLRVHGNGGSVKPTLNGVEWLSSSESVHIDLNNFPQTSGNLQHAEAMEEYLALFATTLPHLRGAASLSTPVQEHDTGNKTTSRFTGATLAYIKRLVADAPDVLGDACEDHLLTLAKNISSNPKPLPTERSSINPSHSDGNDATHQASLARSQGLSHLRASIDELLCNVSKAAVGTVTARLQSLFVAPARLRCTPRDLLQVNRVVWQPYLSRGLTGSSFEAQPAAITSRWKEILDSLKVIDLSGYGSINHGSSPLSMQIPVEDQLELLYGWLRHVAAEAAADYAAASADLHGTNGAPKTAALLPLSPSASTFPVVPRSEALLDNSWRLQTNHGTSSHLSVIPLYTLQRETSLGQQEHSAHATSSAASGCDAFTAALSFNGEIGAPSAIGVGNKQKAEAVLVEVAAIAHAVDGGAEGGGASSVFGPICSAIRDCIRHHQHVGGRVTTRLACQHQSSSDTN